MPKIVDHEERRRALAEALWRVIAESGPQAVSIRGVAAEAGLSTGALRHYFQTRQELLAYALDLSEDRVVQRMNEHGRTFDPEGPMVDRVLGFAEQMLPLDPTRRAEYRAWEATGDPDFLDPRLQERWDRQRGLYRRLVGGLGGFPPLEDPALAHPEPWLETWSEYLHIFVDGLALQLMTTPEQVTPEAARSRLRAFLTHIEATAPRARH
ncbi:TetR/AcrR family transcriptional regulator [Nocardiopsis sp. MG754419]|uniref:TetR/AcrR family transcriptional regulator n=1 Tax=Nocardiopsis sp. MG754419 TaxID=2259865 RepID=UPI001BAD18A9|nr:TetR/AcrR family transcriptional regulator [Nocardiopsis sp. MG754419]MBR8743905.1 TetR/AcrR family transcriptional regulator [Nocardiopsis sp. MG754419]